MIENRNTKKRDFEVVSGTASFKTAKGAQSNVSSLVSKRPILSNSR